MRRHPVHQQRILVPTGAKTTASLLREHPVAVDEAVAPEQKSPPAEIPAADLRYLASAVKVRRSIYELGALLGDTAQVGECGPAGPEAIERSSAAEVARMVAVEIELAARSAPFAVVAGSEVEGLAPEAIALQELDWDHLVCLAYRYCSQTRAVAGEMSFDLGTHARRERVAG